MKSFNRQLSIFTTLLSLFLAGMAWLAIAPTQLGGSVTYVIVDGNSMEPRFRFGDLVLVRTESAYGEGDAVVYRNAEMGRYVFHRIVGAELDRFILKGDHNEWLDSYRPVQDEIVGKLWVHIPKLGKVIERVRLPINMALTVALLGGVLMSGMIVKPGKNRGKGNSPAKNFGGLYEGGLYIFVFLALAFLGLTIFSFTRPLTRSSGNIPYQQEGYFYYSAAGAPGIYDAETIRSGEPIFPKLTCFLNIGFTYNLLAGQLQGVSGSHQLYARVMDSQSGWQRTVPLNPQSGFNGNSYFTMATLDLCQVESLVDLVEKETGLRAATYTLEITADVSVSAEIAGSPISDTFAPSLLFKFDKVHFYLANDDPQVDPLRTLKQGLAGGSEVQTNTLSVLNFTPTVRSVRVFALLGFGFSLMGLFAFGLHLYRTAQQSQDALIRLKYGGMLVDVYEQNLAPTSSTIDVTTMDNLAKLAERHGTVILHMTHNFLHYYLVQANGVTYRFMIPAGKKGDIETNLFEYKARKIEPPQLEPMEITKPNPLVEETESGADENNASIPEAELAWKQIQSEALNYLASHAENQTSQYADPAPETLAYEIQTGEIGFYVTEPTEAVVLRKIKL